jgi:hypothetical protein
LANIKKQSNRENKKGHAPPELRNTRHYTTCF